MVVQTKVIREWANDGQRWLVERGAAPTLLVGGINSGKTVACVLKLIALLFKYPGSRAVVVRRSYTQLLKTTMETWYQWCTPSMYNRGNRTQEVLDLNNGSRVYFIHLDQPNSLDLLAGLEVNFAYVSQVEEITDKAWDQLDVRVGRWTGAVIPEAVFAESGGRENWPYKNKQGDCIPPRYIFAEGYVTDEGHWLFDRFAEGSPNHQKWAAQGYESRIVWSEENIYAIRATIDAALAKDEDYIRKFVRPKWGNPEGTIFTIPEMSKLEPYPWLIEKILRTMKLHRSLDHGEFSPSCCLWEATDHHGNIFVYREYYKGNTLISIHRQNIFDLSKTDSVNGSGLPKYYSQMADPSIFRKDRGKKVDSPPTWSVADDYRDTRLMPKDTVIHWMPSQNDEEATRSRMKEYLKIDPNHRHPITGELGAPHLYLIKKTPLYPNGCNMVIKEVSAQQRVKAKVGDRDVWLDERDEKVVDHSYDTLKYFVISRPSLGPMVEVATVTPGQIPLADYEAAEKSGRSRRRFEERLAGVGALGYGS